MKPPDLFLFIVLCDVDPDPRSRIEAVGVDVIAFCVDVDAAQELCRAHIVYSFLIDCHELIEGIVHDTAGFVIQKFLGAIQGRICREAVVAVIEVK